MIWLALRTWTIVCIAAGIWGCATMVPERKVPLEKSRIQEEDITEGQAAPSPGPEEPANVQPAPAPGYPSESPFQPAEPGSRPPRRLKFRDRGFEPSDGVIRNAGTIDMTDCLSKVMLYGSNRDSLRLVQRNTMTAAARPHRRPKIMCSGGNTIA
jgi:hypothetical protein